MADKLTIIEDEGAEQLAREGEFELAIPFSLYLYNDGGIRINVFPSLKKDAEEFLSLFPDDRMFSSEALGWACERFGGAISAEGYTTEDTDVFFYDYLVKGADRSLILPETFRVCGSEEAENLTGYDFGYMTNYGHVCFAAEVDGKIVAAACTNYPVLLADDQYDRRVEIGVETSPEYRRCGYGISCAAALVNELVAQGFEVLYECGSDNPASVALVDRLGGSVFAKNFCVVGRKETDE